MKKILLFLNLIVIVLLSLFWIFVAIPFLLFLLAFCFLGSDGRIEPIEYPVRTFILIYLILTCFIGISFSLIKSFIFGKKLLKSLSITKKSTYKILLYLLIDSIPVLYFIIV